MSTHALTVRIQSWRSKLATIDRALDQEMQLHYSARRQSLMLFLYREKVVCSGIVSELESLVKEMDDSKLDDSKQ